MGFDLLFFGVGSYLGVYLAQQYGWVLPTLKGPEDLVRTLSEKVAPLVQQAGVMGGRTRSPVYQTLTGEIYPNNIPSYQYGLEELLSEQASNKWTNGSVNVEGSGKPCM